MKKIIIVLSLLFFLIISLSLFFLIIGKKSSAEKQSSKNQQSASVESIVIKPQEPSGKVLIDSVILAKNGFVVVRRVDDGKVSQVIEMSRPLKKGINKDVEISLGRTDVSGKELVVMIYEDYANDGVFNDLDMPALSGEGLTTANFVITGKSVPVTMTEVDMPGMNMPGMKAMVKIRYTDNGFVPDKIEVKKDDMVEFVNESSKDMWVASMPHPQHIDLPTFDQYRAYKKGAIYRYVFEKKGKWEFHDHLNPSFGGIVTVL